MGPLDFWQQKSQEMKQMQQQAAQAQQQQLAIEQGKLQAQQTFQQQQLALQAQKDEWEKQIRLQEAQAKIAKTIAEAENITFEQAMERARFELEQRQVMAEISNPAVSIRRDLMFDRFSKELEEAPSSWCELLDNDSFVKAVSNVLNRYAETEERLILEDQLYRIS